MTEAANAHLINFKTFEPGGWNEEQPSCVRMIFNPTPEMVALVAPLRACSSRGLPSTLLQLRLYSLAVSYFPALGGKL